MTISNLIYFNSDIMTCSNVIFGILLYLSASIRKQNMFSIYIWKSDSLYVLARRDVKLRRGDISSFLEDVKSNIFIPIECDNLIIMYQ